MDKINDKLEIKITDFLSGYGGGYGGGSGNGNGSGNGDGNGNDNGSGYGSGYGYGDGYGDGDGSEYGDGYKINLIKYNNKLFKPYKIDGIWTIITSVKDNIAKGAVLTVDFTFKKCYLAKYENYIAHGETIEQAISSAYDKYIQTQNVEEKLKIFKAKFNKQNKYEMSKFYDWHYNLTGSCEFGRDNFVKEKNLDLTEKITVKEFLELVKGEFGWETISKLEEHYNE